MEFHPPGSSGDSHFQGFIEPQELRPLLEQLHSPETSVHQVDERATVAAVSEATGLPETQVWDALHKLRSEDLQARLAERLREAEEPLYRVERPGFTAETPTFLGRQRAFQSILDTVPRLDSQKQAKLAPKQETADERASRWAARLVLAFMLLMFAVVGVVAIFTALRGLPR